MAHRTMCTSGIHFLIGQGSSIIDSSVAVWLYVVLHDGSPHPDLPHIPDGVVSPQHSHTIYIQNSAT